MMRTTDARIHLARVLNKTRVQQKTIVESMIWIQVTRRGKKCDDLSARGCTYMLAEVYHI